MKCSTCLKWLHNGGFTTVQLIKPLKILLHGWIMCFGRIGRHNLVPVVVLSCFVFIVAKTEERWEGRLRGKHIVCKVKTVAVPALTVT